MAENNNQGQEEMTAQREARQPQAANAGIQQGRPCPKDCRKCTMAQQICCSAKMTFDSYGVMAQIIQRLDIQSQRIADLEQRLNAIQSAEAEFASPSPMQGELFATEED